MNRNIELHSKKQEIIDKINKDVVDMKAEIKLIGECPKTMKDQLLKYFNEKYSLKENKLEDVVQCLEKAITDIETAKSNLEKFSGLSNLMKDKKNGGVH